VFSIYKAALQQYVSDFNEPQIRGVCKILIDKQAQMFERYLGLRETTAGRKH